MNKCFYLFLIVFFSWNLSFAEDSFLTLVKNGSLEEIKEAVKNGMDVNETSSNGVTALMIAAQYNPSVGVIEFLIDKGAKINARNSVGATVLMASLGNYNTEILKTIIKAGIDINAVGQFNVTALMLAARTARNKEPIKLLLDAGADINIKDVNGYTALDYAKRNPAINNSSVLLWLKNNF